MNTTVLRNNKSVEAKAWELKRHAEDKVIGMCLMDPSSVRRISHILTGKSFSGYGYGDIFDLAVQLYESNAGLGHNVFMSECRKRGYIDAIGGPKVVLELVSDLPHCGHAEYEALELDRYNSLNSIQDACAQTTLLAQDLKADPKTVIEHFTARTSGLGNSKDVGFRKASDVLKEMLFKYENPDKGTNRRSFNSGFPTLDRLLGGFETGGLHLVGGKSGYGKSALACNFAFNMAFTNAKVWFVSLEMKNEQLSARIVSNIESINYSRFKHGFQPGEVARLKSGIKTLEQLDLVLTDQASETMKSIAAKARLKKSLSGLDVLVVDNLNLIRWSSRVTKREALKEHTEAFKILAKDLDIAVILLGQLGADDKEKRSVRPNNESWAENRKISDDADTAIMLHKDDPASDTGELIVTKQRDGQLETIELSWEGKYQRFTEKFRAL